MSHALLKRMFPQDQHHIAGLHATVRQLLPASGKLLDLGCGINRDFAPYRTPTREIWGTDFSAHSQLAHPEYFRLLRPDGTIPFDDNTFDVITAVMVLEHVAKPIHFFREIARVLRPGGHFIGHTISGSHYVTLFRRAVGILPHSVNQWLVKTLYGRAEEDTFPTFYRLNRLASLCRVLQQVQLSPPVLKRYADPGYFRFNATLENVAIRADHYLDRLVPGWGRLYLTVTTQKPTPAKLEAK